MRLVIVHYHMRPGGVRRVIELAAPYLIREFGGRTEEIVLATGERPDAKWESLFRRKLEPTPVRLFVEPHFNYLSEQKGAASQINHQIRKAVEKLLQGAMPENTLVWAHNLGVARNLLLSRELGLICAARSLRLASHHHDWWFDNRWRRWREMRRYGFRTLEAAARAIFPVATPVRHLAINRADASHLERGFSKRAGWLPNLADRGKPPAADRVRMAREWLQRQLSAECGMRNAKLSQSLLTSGRPASARQASLPTGKKGVPIWLLPSRLLRRKNVAEALLLTRWLRPGAWLVTTGGASSADERAYYQTLDDSARRHGWPLRLGVLQGDESNKPGVPELLGASEAVLLTSIQEGFGLPYLEAAAAERPLIARMIPNIGPDLEAFGFKFPQSYTELMIEPGLFDWVAERQRQEKLYRKWHATLPREAQRLAEKPALLAAGQQPLPFSRLTLIAQLEVLSHPADKSWHMCSPLNPFLNDWRLRAETGRLRKTPWPRKADKWLSGPAYAERFREIVFSNASKHGLPGAALRVQGDFLRENVRADHLFPLLWDA